VEPPKPKPIPKIEKPKKEKSGVTEKLNLNTATRQEMTEVLGICDTTARQIIQIRKQIGEYKELEELRLCSRIGPMSYHKYKEMFYI
jgi:competence protein ComEA